MHSQCSHCKTNIEPNTYHEAIDDPLLGKCRVKDVHSGIPLYTSQKKGSGYGKE